MVAPGAVGLIAGSGRLPELLAEAVKTQGRFLVVLTLEGTSSAAARFADHSYRVGADDLQRMLALLGEHQVRELVFAGNVPRITPIDRVAASFRTMAAAGPQASGQRLFQRGIALLAERGITVRGPLDVRPDLATPPGVLTERGPAADEWDDIRRGMAVARILAGEEIGQTVALRRGVVVAVEAAEGTDAAIHRAGTQTGGAVIVKAARPQQDLRFDLPTAGPVTVDVMRAAGASALALEAGRTLLLDREAAIAAADAAGLAIVGVE